MKQLLFLRVVSRGHRPLLGRVPRTLQLYQAAGCFHLGRLREPVLWGWYPGQVAWEPQPRKLGSDQPWVRPSLELGSHSFPAFALNLPS